MIQVSFFLVTVHTPHHYCPSHLAKQHFFLIIKTWIRIIAFIAAFGLFALLSSDQTTYSTATSCRLQSISIPLSHLLFLHAFSSCCKVPTAACWIIINNQQNWTKNGRSSSQHGHHKMLTTIDNKQKLRAKKICIVYLLALKSYLLWLYASVYYLLSTDYDKPSYVLPGTWFILSEHVL